MRNFVETHVEESLVPGPQDEHTGVLLVHVPQDEDYAQQLCEDLNSVFSGWSRTCDFLFLLNLILFQAPLNAHQLASLQR